MMAAVKDCSFCFGKRLFARFTLVALHSSGRLTEFADVLMPYLSILWAVGIPTKRPGWRKARLIHFPFSFVLVLTTLYINTKKGDYQLSRSPEKLYHELEGIFQALSLQDNRFYH
jgi:hypothetical protein